VTAAELAIQHLRQASHHDPVQRVVLLEQSTAAPLYTQPTG